MAAVKETFPTELLNAPTEDFLKYYRADYLFAQFDTLTYYYNQRIPLQYALSDYGAEIYGDSEQQCSCTLLEHGTEDIHKSARFYPYDRNSGEKEGRVYCHKCKKVYSAFPYIIRQEKDYHHRSMKETLVYIEKRYNVPLPRDLLLAFNPLTFYSFIGSEKDQKIKMAFLEAETLARCKESDPEAFCDGLEELFYRTE